MRTQSGNYFRNQIHSKPAPILWYVLANRTHAVFYEETRNQEFKFRHRMKNPKGHLTEGQLDSDRPGSGISSAAGGTIRHGLDRTFHHHEQNALRFAHAISSRLLEEKRQDSFQGLVLVAEPHFLGLLRKALPSELKPLIQQEVDREYIEGSDAELHSAIQDALSRKP